jgi:hypothetical protein
MARVSELYETLSETTERMNIERRDVEEAMDNDGLQYAVT